MTKAFDGYPQDESPVGHDAQMAKGIRTLPEHPRQHPRQEPESECVEYTRESAGRYNEEFALFLRAVDKKIKHDDNFYVYLQ